MLTDDQLRTLARASAMYGHFGDRVSAHPWDERIRDLALDALGRPSDDDVVTSAIGALASDDRNLRAAALRVLRWHLGDPRAIDAVVRATDDAARRVRRIAVGLCGLLTDRPRVADRLREMIDDPREVPKVARCALSALVNTAVRPLPESVRRSIVDLLDADALREHVLLRLLQQPLDDSARAILRDVVRTGSKGEAVAATRALCGQRIVNLAHVPPEQRRDVEATAELVDLSWLTAGVVNDAGYRVGHGYANASLYWLPA